MTPNPKRRPLKRPPAALAVALALLAASTVSWADDDGKRSPRVAPLPSYARECGACHVAFPVGLLPAQSWQRLMANLPRHYGTDASLDAATANAIGVWLTANAGSGKRASEAPPEDRITRGSWFVREHREVSPQTWKLAAVKSPSNCAACHRSAEQGNYSERDIAIPR
ncbi:MAG: diheme cytochrome c [Rubrivivax sp.]|nr:diheme cytochrome c [Rubrivivax sp.]